MRASVSAVATRANRKTHQRIDPLIIAAVIVVIDADALDAVLETKFYDRHRDTADIGRRSRIGEFHFSGPFLVCAILASSLQSTQNLLKSSLLLRNKNSISHQYLSFSSPKVLKLRLSTS